MMIIIDKQYQEQLPVFHPLPRNAFTHKKIQHVVQYPKGKDKARSNFKRLSCHNISRESGMEMERSKQKPCFNNKMLDHILGNIKQKYKSSLRQKQLKDSNSKNKQIIEKVSNKSQDLNYSNNLKIISINNAIKPKNGKNVINNKTASVPFKNKKLMNLRKGKSYKLYTQQIQNDIHDIYNQNSILPWDELPNNILPWEQHSKQLKKPNEEQQNLQESYLKSHEIKMAPKSNTLHLQVDKQPPFQKYSTLQLIQYNKIKQQLINTQIFSNTINRNPSKLQPKRNNKQQFNRALTEMKMEIDQINLSANHQSYSKDINIESFFQLIKPSHKRQRKYSINQPSKRSQSYRKNSGENMSSNFMMSGKKYDRI